MFRSQFIAVFLTVCGIFAWATGAMAQEPKPSVAAEKPAGRFLQFLADQEDAKKTANRTIRNFYLSLLHAVGDKRENFGELDSKMPAAAQAGPLAEILT